MVDRHPHLHPRVDVVPAGAGEPADELAGSCADLWLAAFAGPPWFATPAGVPDQADAIRWQWRVPTTTIALTHDEAGSLVGAGWAWNGDQSPDDDLHTAVRDAVGPDQYVALTRPEMRVLVEVMTHPNAQRRGIGGAIIDTLTATGPSWLLTHPAGAGAGLYGRLGWTTIGALDHHAAPLRVMLRPASP